MRRVIIVGFLLASWLAGCQAAKPSYDYRTGDVLLEEEFNASFAWEAYENPAAGVSLRVEDGVYRMTQDSGGYIWGLGSASYDNVVVEAESTQLSDDDDNAYGVICRADPSNNGEGYYFLISGDGYWSIRRQQGRAMDALIEFSRSDAIHQGQSINRIRALCIDDYLALYVNDEFVGEARDDLYARGFVGFTIAARDEGRADIYFDDLRVIEGRLVTP